jgi:sirohydrochlorin ferrochelatase
MAPTLVAVAHGSRDPRSAATVTRLLDEVRTARPDLDVRAAFLDLSAPRLTDVLESLPGEAGVVPLLLGRAYHARVDIPAMIAAARRPALVADVLGPDDRLESVALQRLCAAGARLNDRRLGVVLAGAGSSHAPANAAVSTVASRWVARYGWAGAVAAFASATGPDVPTAIRQLRARGARRIAVASWFLAPGQLPDRITSQALETDPAALIADPLGAHPDLAELVSERYEDALVCANKLQYA